MKTFLSNIAKSDHHQTPQRAKDFLKEIELIDIDFMYDPCPYHSEFNGLEKKWQAVNFVNPPYSLIESFVKKAFKEYLNRKTIYFLFPLSKTDKPYFHKYLEPFKENFIYFPFRLKFEGSDNPSFQTHCLVVMK